MDPLTHGIAGALIAKAFFAGPGTAPQQETPKAGQAWRPVLLITLGALFPDIDVVSNLFSSSKVATLEYHRWVTHSILCLPIFALALAAAAYLWRQYRDARRERPAPGTELKSGLPVQESPALLRLASWFAVGIGSHIFLDLITSWGTMLWAPLRRERVNWDWVFIVDGTFTTLLLLPQLLHWIYSSEEKAGQRRLYAWGGLSAGAVLLQQFSSELGVGFSFGALVAVILVLALLLFGPEAGGWGYRHSRAQWCRAGVALVCVYLLLCFGAQRWALARVEEFVRAERLHAQRTGALPMPPSFLRWAGMVRTSAGVYQANIRLLDRKPPQFEFIADRATPESLEAARGLSEVQTFLWFARFPVVETRIEGGERILMFTDRRFVQRWASAPAPFEYWVVLDPLGHVVRQGWAQRILLEQGQPF